MYLKIHRMSKQTAVLPENIYEHSSPCKSMSKSIQHTIYSQYKHAIHGTGPFSWWNAERIITSTSTANIQLALTLTLCQQQQSRAIRAIRELHTHDMRRDARSLSFSEYAASVLVWVIFVWFFGRNVVLWLSTAKSEMACQKRHTNARYQSVFNGSS